MATITSNPSATSLQTPAAQQFVQNQIKVPTYGSSVTDSLGRVGTAAFDPNTGQPLANPTATNSSQSTTTATPTPAPTAPTQNDAAYNAYKAALTDNTGVSTAQSAYNDYIANQSKSVAGLSGQGRGIPLSLIRGQQQLLLNQTNPEATRLQNQVGIEQTTRQANIDAAKAGLDYATTEQTLSKPVFGYAGQSGYQLNPTTGQYEQLAAPQQPGGIVTGAINPNTGLSPNASVNDILGYLGQNGVDPTRYDMAGLISAIQGGATAQDIISGRAGAAATKAGATAQATNKSQLKFNPLTGQEEYFTPTVGGKSVAGISTNSGGSSSGPSIGSIANTSSGATTQQIKAVQQALGITADGQYGPQTKAAVAKFQSANGLPATGVIDSQTLAAGQFGVDTNVGSSTQQSSGPDNLPNPTNKVQLNFANDLASGGLSHSINAQNTAIGHLVDSLDLGKEMQNISLQGGNALKNWLNSETGKAAVNNYTLAHQLASSELSSAYGNDTGAERTITASLANGNASPEQILGYVQTSSKLLASKVLSNIQSYKTAYGQNAALNLNWFVSPQNQQALSSIGIQLHQDGNNVGAYQLQPDGSYKQI